jgi:hypothetical protein
MAEIRYLTNRMTAVVAFEELEDLQNIVEQGPDWNEIDFITVTLNRPSVEPKREAREAGADQ